MSKLSKLGRFVTIGFAAIGLLACVSVCCGGSALVAGSVGAPMLVGKFESAIPDEPGFDEPTPIDEPGEEDEVPIIGGDFSEESPGGEPTVAGADFFAIEVVEEPAGSGWYVVTEAGNKDLCAWSVRVSEISVEGEVDVTVPQCWEMHIVGTGTITATFSAGPNYEDALIDGTSSLALWPYGHNALMTVVRKYATSSTWLDANSPGVALEKDMTSRVTITFELEDGVVTMPLGEVRNNVLPQY